MSNWWQPFNKYYYSLLETDDIYLQVEELYHKVWSKGEALNYKTLEETRDFAQDSLKHLRPDHKRSLNPTPYKVSVSDQLYQFIHKLWLENAPIGELS